MRDESRTIRTVPFEEAVREAPRTADEPLPEEPVLHDKEIPEEETVEISLLRIRLAEAEVPDEQVRTLPLELGETVA